MQPGIIQHHAEVFALPGNARDGAGSMRLFGAVATMCVALGGGCQKASTTDPDPPSGGGNYVLDYNVFAAQIDPLLTTLGCDDVNCHGGGIRGTFELSPDNDKDVAFDYEQASLQVVAANPPASPLILKPLDEACGGVGHGGGAFFHSLDDPDYLAILAWIEAGEYQ
jgi:hypothetical protein